MSEIKRAFGLDIIKSFAILFVVGVHFFLNTNFYNVSIEGISMIFQLECRWIFIICVPLFLLLTGYLQANKELSIDYFKKIIFILGIYLFYSLASIIMKVVYFGQQGSIMKWVSEILGFQANGYSWYINMYIGLFVLTPFLNIIFNNIKQKKQHQILLLAMVFLTLLPGFLNSIPLIPGRASYSILPDYWINFYPVTYYFIGCYLRKYQVIVNKAFAIVVFIGITVLETILTYYFSWGKTFTYVIGDYGSLLVAIQAVSFFLIFYKTNINNKYARGLLGLISAVSLDIYLCSYLTDQIIYNFVMEKIFISQQQVILIAVPTVAISFTIAFIVAVIRYRLTGAASKLLLRL